MHFISIILRQIKVPVHNSYWRARLFVAIIFQVSIWGLTLKHNLEALKAIITISNVRDSAQRKLGAEWCGVVPVDRPRHSRGRVRGSSCAGLTRREELTGGGQAHHKQKTCFCTVWVERCRPPSRALSLSLTRKPVPLASCLLYNNGLLAPIFVYSPIGEYRERNIY